MENWFSMFKKWQKDFEMAWMKQNKKDDFPIASAFLDEFGEMVSKKHYELVAVMKINKGLAKSLTKEYNGIDRLFHLNEQPNL